MKGSTRDWLLALVGGGLLALLINSNSILAAYSTPLLSSWVAHGVGAVVALIMVLVVARLYYGSSRILVAGDSQSSQKQSARLPLWAYLGGILGAIVVALAGMSVNDGVGLSGTIVLGLVGQIVLSIVVDHFGLMGVKQRRLSRNSLYGIACVLLGSFLITYSGS